MPAGKYRKLAQGRKLFGLALAQGATLWLGPDHVLHVAEEGYTDRCRRFYLNELQAITLTRTVQHLYSNAILASVVLLLGLVFGGLARQFPDEWVAFAFMGTLFSAPFIVILIVNLAKGPTCVCRFHTAVSAEEIAALNRWRVARRVAAELVQHIEAVQGRLAPALIENGDGDAPQVVEAATHVQARTRVKAAAARPFVHRNETVHLAFFSSLLVLGASSSMGGVLSFHYVYTILDGLVSAAVFALGIAACVVQRDSDVPREVRTMTLSSVGAIIAMFAAGAAIGLVWMFMMSMENPMGPPVTQDDALRRLNEAPFIAEYSMLTALCCAALGTLGLMAVRRWRLALRADAAEKKARAAGDAAGSAAEPPDEAAEEEA